MRQLAQSQQQGGTKDDYFYIASATALAPAGSVTDNVNIETDSNFIWQKISYFANLANAAQTESSRVIPLINVQFLDSGSGRNLQNNPLPIPAIAGNGQLPFIMPVPRILRANATLSVTFTNFDAAATYNITLVLSGYKNFNY